MLALVVDDSAAMRRIQQRTLESLGWEVIGAGDGAHALVALRARRECRLVLADWHMPGMDGLALVQAIRAEPELAAVKVIMITSEGAFDCLERALAAGADDLMMKPFGADALSERIDEVMRVA